MPATISLWESLLEESLRLIGRNFQKCPDPKQSSWTQLAAQEFGRKPALNPINPEP